MGEILSSKLKFLQFFKEKWIYLWWVILFNNLNRLLVHEEKYENLFNKKLEQICLWEDKRLLVKLYL